MRCLLLAAALCCTALLGAAQTRASLQAGIDSDGDGLSDSLETALLERFQPQLMIDAADCSEKPASFAPDQSVPTAKNDDGTLYGQVFPRHTASAEISEIELHFYHLWRIDCGRMGHPLDAEHISVLLRGSGADPRDWHGVLWYAAAHEDTVCDASQMTRASTLDAEDRGATVWISAGKHGSFLNEDLCQHGCGGDRCPQPKPLKVAAIINLGELSHPRNGALWLSSSHWPLAEKMRRSDFSSTRIALIDRLPRTDIAWANPSKRPVQAVLYGGNSAIDGALTGGNSTADALALSHRETDTALVLATDRTNTALGDATHSTGRAISKSYRSIRRALGGAARHTGEALGVDPQSPPAGSPVPQL